MRQLGPRTVVTCPGPVGKSQWQLEFQIWGKGQSTALSLELGILALPLLLILPMGLGALDQISLVFDVFTCKVRNSVDCL